METRLLGKTDLRVSRFSLGTMTFGGQTSESDAIRIMDHAIDAGINFFDTANAYHKGVAETITGKGLKGRRHKVVLATKVREKMGEEPDEQGLSRPAIRRAIHESLRRLQTDYVDLYYLHRPDRAAPIEETLATMDELVQEGKVRYPATSNYASWQDLRMLWISENHGYTPISVSQPMYNLLARGIEQEYLEFCKEYGIAVVPYNPLAGGLLTGKHAEPQAPTPGTRFDGNRMYQDRYWHPQNFEAVSNLAKIAGDAGMSLVALALRWLLDQPMVDSVILGATRLEQLEENLLVADRPSLSPEVREQCDGVWRSLRGITPQFNR